MRDFTAKHVAVLPPSGIRKFFDIVATMDNVISLGVGEPDFKTPERVRKAAMDSLAEGKTRFQLGHAQTAGGNCPLSETPL